MKPYKGIIRISCCKKVCDQKLIQPKAECINCVHGTVEILDLEGKVLERFKREMPKIREMPKVPKIKNKPTGSQL